MKDKFILDACCGPRMMWFNKRHPNTLYIDIRRENFIASGGDKIIIDPDMIADFRNLPFPDKSFKLVVWDPPHMKTLSTNGYETKGNKKGTETRWFCFMKIPK